MCINHFDNYPQCTDIMSQFGTKSVMSTFRHRPQMDARSLNIVPFNMICFCYRQSTVSQEGQAVDGASLGTMRMRHARTPKRQYAVAAQKDTSFPNGTSWIIAILAPNVATVYSS